MTQFSGQGGAEHRGVAGGRPQSVTLRAGAQPGAMPDAMDPAHQSLAEALRVTYRLLIVTMIILGGIYLFSGFKAVQEGKRGIRLLFGRVDGSDLPPGFTFTAPFPFGDLLRVDRTPPQMSLDEQYWPGLSEAEKKMRVDEITPRSLLSPARDGYLLTADSAIVHAKWTVDYRRSSVAQWAQNIHPDHEAQIVQRAVQGGILRAVAATTIDDLLSPEDSEAFGRREQVVRRAQQAAQKRLDELQSGIEIEQLKLVQAIPPLAVRDQFAKVTSAASTAGTARKNAETEADTALAETAGGAARPLVRAIDRYEEAISLGDAAQQDQLLAAIFGLLEGRPVQMDGQTLEIEPAGRVAALLADADRYRTSIADQRRSEIQEFRGKLEVYRQNPLVLVHREWAERLGRFLDNDAVQVMFVPQGTSELDIALNLDPDIVKAQEKAQKLRENELAAEARMRRQQEAQHTTDTQKRILDSR